MAREVRPGDRARVDVDAGDAVPALVLGEPLRGEEDGAVPLPLDPRVAARELAEDAADPIVTEVAGRALAYGLARMFLDGHLPREGAMELTAAVLDVLGEGLAQAPPGGVSRSD